MITGHGMVAKAFRSFSEDERVHVFASGVSKSRETDASSFQREAELIKAQRHIPGRFIYFSTSSIFDPSLTETPYVRHKLDMEDLVRGLFPDHLILRLPNLIGRTENPFTLTNFLRDRILRNEVFELHEKACRYLMDVDDMAMDLTPLMIRPELQGHVLNVNSSRNVPLPELLAAMEIVLQQRARAIKVNKGSCYIIDNARFLSFLTVERRSVHGNPDTLAILRKYYG